MSFQLFWMLVIPMGICFQWRRVLGCHGTEVDGSMVSRWVIYKLLINGIYWGWNPLILTFYPSGLGYITSLFEVCPHVFDGFFGNRIAGSTTITLLHEKINPKSWQVLSLGDAGFLQFFQLFCIRISHPHTKLLVDSQTFLPHIFFGTGRGGEKHIVLFDLKHLPTRWAPILVINGVLQVGWNDPSYHGLFSTIFLGGLHSPI